MGHVGMVIGAVVVAVPNIPLVVVGIVLRVCYRPTWHLKEDLYVMVVRLAPTEGTRIVLARIGANSSTWIGLAYNAYGSVYVTQGIVDLEGITEGITIGDRTPTLQATRHVSFVAKVGPAHLVAITSIHMATLSAWTFTLDVSWLGNSITTTFIRLVANINRTLVWLVDFVHQMVVGDAPMPRLVPYASTNYRATSWRWENVLVSTYTSVLVGSYSTPTNQGTKRTTTYVLG